jgi:hypothetical protein
MAWLSCLEVALYEFHVTFDGIFSTRNPGFLVLDMGPIFNAGCTHLGLQEWRLLI